MKLAMIQRIERMDEDQMVNEAICIISHIDSKPRLSRNDLIERLAIRNSWRSGNADFFGSLRMAHDVYSE